MKEVLPSVARALRLNIQPWEVRAADDFDRVFAALIKERPIPIVMVAKPNEMLDLSFLERLQEERKSKAK